GANSPSPHLTNLLGQSSPSVDHRQKKRPAGLHPFRPHGEFCLTMTNITTPASAVERDLRLDTPGEPHLILSSLRVAATRSRLTTNILDNVGVALRQKPIDCAGALAWLKDEGLLDHLPFGLGASRG